MSKETLDFIEDIMASMSSKILVYGIIENYPMKVSDFIFKASRKIQEKVLARDKAMRLEGFEGAKIGTYITGTRGDSWDFKHTSFKSFEKDREKDNA